MYWSTIQQLTGINISVCGFTFTNNGVGSLVHSYVLEYYTATNWN